MKKNRVILIVVIILVLIAAFFILTERNSTLNRTASIFAVKDTASITKIFLVDKSNQSVLLERKDNGEWELNGRYKAHPFQVIGFLETLMDLEVRSPVPKAARNNVISRLSASSVKIEIYQKKPMIDVLNLFPREKLSKVYFVGGATQDNRGTYMLMEGHAEPFVVYIPSFRGFVAPRYSTNEDDWRDHTIFKTPLKDIAEIRLDFFEDASESFRVIRNQQGEFDLFPASNQGKVPYDTLRMLNFLSAFEDLRFEAILNNSIEQNFIDSVKHSQPAHSLTLVDVNGDSTTIVTRRKKGFSEIYDEKEGIQLVPFDLDRLYAFVNNGNDFVLLQYFVFDKALRSASYLRGLEDEHSIPKYDF